MNYKLISEKILEIYKECNITSFPIDCAAILKHYGYKVLTYKELQSKNEELYRLCSLLSDDAFSDRVLRIVAYNHKTNAGRIRFSLMHELGHIILSHTSHSQANENEADYFASNILAPRPVIFRANAHTADAIHEKFGLSYAAANIALDDYKHWKCFKISQTDKEIAWLFFPKTHKNVSKPNFNKSKIKPIDEELNKRREFIEAFEPDFYFRRTECDRLYENL